MAAGKYGRLFTEADIRLLAARWLGGRPMGPDIMVETLDDLERAGRLTFPADEPLFLLRGQDRAASFAIASTQPESTGIDYAQAALNVGATHRHLDEVWKAAARMREWQAANPDRVKVPD